MRLGTGRLSSCSQRAMASTTASPGSTPVQMTTSSNRSRLEELLARLRARLRRAGPTESNEVLRYGDLSLDLGSREVRRADRGVELTRTEFLLLELFLRHPGRVLTRQMISANVWDYDFGPASNSLDVYIGYLRRKTEADGESRLIQTVRGVGYVLRE